MTSRGRRTAARAVALAGALLWGVASFGVVDTLVVIVQDERFAESYLLESGWGLLFVVLVSVPLLAVAVWPELTVPTAQVVAVGCAVAVAALLAGYPAQLMVALLLAVTGGVLVAIMRQRPQLPHRGVDPALLLLAGLALCWSLPLAWRQSRGWQGGHSDVTLGLDHRPMQAALGLAVPLVAACGAAAFGSRQPGWRVPVWTAAVAAAWLGVESLVYPDLTGSLGTTSGLLAVAWGLAIVVVAERRWRSPHPGSVHLADRLDAGRG